MVASVSCLLFCFVFCCKNMRYQALTIVILAVLVAVVASTSSDSLPPNSFSLFRDTTKRQRLVAQWLEDHPELRDEYVNRKVPLNADHVKRRGGKARQRIVEHLEARKEGKETRNDNIPLEGPEKAIGEYYMRFTLGTPPARFTAQVDTGSSDLSIPGANCTHCGNKGDPPYGPANSSTSYAVPCTNPPDDIYCPHCTKGICSYSIRYEDNSGFTSTVFEDLYGMGNYKSYKQAFGTMTTESKNFEPKGVDGIIGFAFAALSEIEADTPVDGLWNSGQIAENVFSMCVTPLGGAVTFGSDGGFYTGKMQYTPIVPDHKNTYYWYQLIIDDMLVNGESFGVNKNVYNNGGSIVDSGTTDFLMPEPAYDAFYELLYNNCSQNNLVGVCGVDKFYSVFNGYCFTMTPQQAAAYPPIEITMDGGVKISVPSKYYITSDYCVKGDYTLNIDPLDKGEGTILGDAVMMNYEVVHDRQNMQVGFGLMHGCPSG